MSPLTYAFAFSAERVGHAINGTPLDTVTADPSAKNADAGDSDRAFEKPSP